MVVKINDNIQIDNNFVNMQKFTNQQYDTFIKEQEFKLGHELSQHELNLIKEAFVFGVKICHNIYKKFVKKLS